MGSVGTEAGTGSLCISIDASTTSSRTGSDPGTNTSTDAENSTVKPSGAGLGAARLRTGSDPGTSATYTVSRLLQDSERLHVPVAILLLIRCQAATYTVSRLLQDSERLDIFRVLYTVANWTDPSVAGGPAVVAALLAGYRRNLTRLQARCL